MATSVKLSSKHQIVVPREARQALGLKPGSRILITVRADGVAEMRREPSDVTKEMEGMLTEADTGADGIETARREGPAALWDELLDE